MIELRQVQLGCTKCSAILLHMSSVLRIKYTPITSLTGPFGTLGPDLQMVRLSVVQLSVVSVVQLTVQY